SSAVCLVDVLDHLYATLVLEIDIDIGRLAARGADEALEQHVDAGRVDRGDAEAVADHRIGRRAAPLAQDAAAPRERDDVVHGQEIAGVVEPLDQRQLVLDQAPDVAGDGGSVVVGVATMRPSRRGRWPLLRMRKIYPAIKSPV